MARTWLSIVIALSLNAPVVASGTLLLDVAPDEWVPRAAAKVQFPDEPLKKEFDRIEERIRNLLQSKALKLPKVVRKPGERAIRPSVMDGAVSLVTLELKRDAEHELALGDLAIIRVLPAAPDNVVLYLRPTVGFLPIKHLEHGAIAQRREWERASAKKLKEWLDQWEKNSAQ